MMSPTDFVLRFKFSDDANADKRSVNVFTYIDGPEQSQEPAEHKLYEFTHPNTGLATGETIVRRKNADTGRWEKAGVIEWQSQLRGLVYFGAAEPVSIQELRRQKQQSSNSRRFKANNSEYKWKRVGKDMVCVSAGTGLGLRGGKAKTIAQWTDDTLTLRVAGRAEEFLDRVVVTCYLNLWIRRFTDTEW